MRRRGVRLVAGLLVATGSTALIPSTVAATALTATTTSLSVSTATPVYGQAVDLTATVSAADSSSTTGTVSFLDQGRLLGVSQVGVVSPGAATFTIGTLAPGDRSLIAEYRGDATHDVSDSAAVTESVGKSSTAMTLDVSPSGSTAGQGISMNAVAVPASPISSFSYTSDGPDDPWRWGEAQATAFPHRRGASAFPPRR